MISHSSSAAHIPQRWPECDRPDLCRASTSFGAGLANQSAYREPAVDRDGKVYEPKIDPPKVTRGWRCETCGKTWSETVEFGA